MKRWQVGAKVTNDKQLVAVVTATSIRDGKQYCRLKVAVENRLTGKIKNHQRGICCGGRETTAHEGVTR